MIINHVNLKEDSPQKVCEALAVCFVRVNCRAVPKCQRDWRIIADAEFCLANDALALGLV